MEDLLPTQDVDGSWQPSPIQLGKAKRPILSDQALNVVAGTGFEPATSGLLICCWIIAFVRVAIHLSSIGVLSTVDVPIHGDDRHDESHEYESPFSTQSSTPLAICS